MSKLPSTLAIVDDDHDFVRYLSTYLAERAIEVRAFGDSDEFLTAAGAFEFDFYIIDLMLPGVDGVDLVRLIRRKGPAGVLVISGRAGAEVFDSVMRAGADMHLMKPVRVEQVALAIEAIHRRIEGGRASSGAWRLDRAAHKLVAPEGTRIDLSEHDVVVIECFVAASGSVVTRQDLCARLGRDPSAEAENLLHAAIYRLRRRIERATPSHLPLHSEAKVGYVFRAPLLAV
jgi:DNA-binding response OmpR family regulator